MPEVSTMRQRPARATNVGLREGICRGAAAAARTGRPGHRAEQARSPSARRCPKSPSSASSADARPRSGTRSRSRIPNLSDLDRELSRAERDVEQVRVRIDRDNVRLDAGQVSSAARARVAAVRGGLAPPPPVRPRGGRPRADGKARERARRCGTAPPSRRSTVTAETATVTARRDVALAEIAEAAGEGDVVPGGRGGRRARGPAGPLRQGARAVRRGRRRDAAPGTVRGLPGSLSTVELNEIRAAAPDEVVRHEECRRILVRTAESGL